MCEALQTYSSLSRQQKLQLLASSDPTRTTTIRNRYAREMRIRFRELRGIIIDAIVNKDVFSLSSQLNFSVNAEAPVSPNQFNFPRSSDKVSAFMEWLQRQVDRNILETQNRRRIGQSINDHWQNIFIEDSYKRGVIRANYELRQAAYPDVASIEARGGISAVMGQPFHVDRLGLLYTRVYNELKGISDSMDQKISRVLSQGLADGDNPRLLARKMNAVIKRSGADLGITDSLGRYIPAERRAEILARTEVINAHHKGMMQEYRNWGDIGLEVQAELRTAGDSRVCDECAGLEGTVYSLGEAENLIPVHPQCRCIVLPVNNTNRRGRSSRSASSSAQSPEWAPTMGRSEAEAWSKNSAFKETLYHGTNVADSIRAEGFDISKLGTNMNNAGMMGAGHYTSGIRAVANAYGDELLELRVNVKKVMDWKKVNAVDVEIPNLDRLRVHYRTQYVELKKQGWDTNPLLNRPLDGHGHSGTVGDLINEMSDKQLQKYLKFYDEYSNGEWASGFVEREIMLDLGYDAVRTAGNGNQPIEFAVLRNEAITVIKD